MPERSLTFNPTLFVLRKPFKLRILGMSARTRRGRPLSHFNPCCSRFKFNCSQRCIADLQWIVSVRSRICSRCIIYVRYVHKLYIVNIYVKFGVFVYLDYTCILHKFYVICTYNLNRQKRRTSRICGARSGSPQIHKRLCCIIS